MILQFHADSLSIWRKENYSIVTIEFKKSVQDIFERIVCENMIVDRMFIICTRSISDLDSIERKIILCQWAFLKSHRCDLSSFINLNGWGGTERRNYFFKLIHMFQLTAHHNCKFRKDKKGNKKFREAEVKVLLVILVKMSISVRHTSLVSVITLSANLPLMFHCIFIHFSKIKLKIEGILWNLIAHNEDAWRIEIYDWRSTKIKKYLSENKERVFCILDGWCKIYGLKLLKKFSTLKTSWANTRNIDLFQEQKRKSLKNSFSWWWWKKNSSGIFKGDIKGVH